MRITLTLPDDLGELYRVEADQRDLPVASVLEDRLKAAQPLDPRKRFVILQQPMLGEVETHLGGGDLRGGGDLLAKVKRLASIAFGPHEIKLTPGQYEELAFRAGRMGKSIEQLVKETWERFCQDFFTLVPGRK